jgi:hypothetical protein
LESAHLESTVINDILITRGHSNVKAVMRSSVIRCGMQGTDILNSDDSFAEEAKATLTLACLQGQATCQAKGLAAHLHAVRRALPHTFLFGGASHANDCRHHVQSHEQSCSVHVPEILSAYLAHRSKYREGNITMTGTWVLQKDINIVKVIEQFDRYVGCSTWCFTVGY